MAKEGRSEKVVQAIRRKTRRRFSATVKRSASRMTVCSRSRRDGCTGDG